MRRGGCCEGRADAARSVRERDCGSEEIKSLPGGPSRFRQVSPTVADVAAFMAALVLMRKVEAWQFVFRSRSTYRLRSSNRVRSNRRLLVVTTLEFYYSSPPTRPALAYRAAPCAARASERWSATILGWSKGPRERRDDRKQAKSVLCYGRPPYSLTTGADVGAARLRVGHLAGETVKASSD